MVPADQYIISPLYQVIGEHRGAAALLVILGLVFWRSTKSRPGTRLARLHERYARLEPMPKVAVSALAISAVVHFGLVFGHEFSGLTIGYLLTGIAMGYGIRVTLAGGRWRRWSAILLGGSLAAFVIVMVAGTAPDQLAMLTKLVELGGFAAVLSPAPGARLARMGTVGIVAVTTIVSLASWAGAFSSGGGHHHGDTPPPAVALPDGEDRDPTPAERIATDDFHADVVRALSPFRDPAVAAAAGYNVDGIEGLDFHADNPALKNDGRIMDPGYPETLVYARGPDGPVLLGAMFQMDRLGETGPAVGGPLTVWHAHDHICISLTGITGVVSPFGACALGSVAIPITNEMIHVFIVDDAPDQFGELSEDWIKQAIGF